MIKDKMLSIIDNGIVITTLIVLFVATYVIIPPYIVFTEASGWMRSVCKKFQPTTQKVSG